MLREFIQLLLFPLFYIIALVRRASTEQSQWESVAQGLEKDVLILLNDLQNQALVPVKFLSDFDDFVARTIDHATSSRTYKLELLNIICTLKAIKALAQTFQDDLAEAGHVTISSRVTPELVVICTELSHVLITARRCFTSQSYGLFLRNPMMDAIVRQHRELLKSLNGLIALIVPIPICRVSLDTLTSGIVPLDLAANGTAKRYRLIECARIVDHGTLTIYEYVDFPIIPYAALSYVWRGNAVEPNSSSARFSVKGAEDADPISSVVLTDACAAALARGVSYIWIDRLCILQNSSDDKRWQIREMYRLYQSCAICIVVPGGLQRLVPLDEETEWIHRGWTLQEALAPPIVVVLFSWKLGASQARAGDDSWGLIEPVCPDSSAMAPLSLILDACTTGYLSFELESGLPRMVQTTIFSAESYEQPLNSVPFWQPTRQIMSPNVSALAIAMSDDMDADIKEYAIWQSALMRTSSRPVDMVFSIMGLFGVNLDPGMFEKHDRLGATISLAQEILKRGGRMSWLGISCLAPPCPYVSTFPVFPHTRVAGKALLKVEGGYQKVSELMLNEYPNAAALVPAPQGHMDDNGYITFTAKAIPIQPLPGSLLETHLQTTPYDNAAKPTWLRAVDKSTWSVEPLDKIDTTRSEHSFEPRFFAVLIGFFNGYYPGGTPAKDANNVRAMLIEEHIHNRFSLKSYFMLSLKSRAWVNAWPLESVTVGGPELINHFETTDEQEIDSSPRISIAPNRDVSNHQGNTRHTVSLKDQTARQARWAVPQATLERSRIRGDDGHEGRMESYMRRF